MHVVVLEIDAMRYGQVRLIRKKVLAIPELLQRVLHILAGGLHSRRQHAATSPAGVHCGEKMEFKKTTYQVLLGVACRGCCSNLLS